eukprot:GFYU01001921.1.p1 GENE.GFYU01001921.1~~GFYU01001921.1.p1  ORF type:complete len:255 (-),score=74.61 GFYU01001921.1:118-882(-)
MSRKIQKPANQLKLTNVAIVRIKKGGKRFELACYKNKVQNWRNGFEKDIDEVLQTHQIFENVSKGKFAQRKDLEAVFGHSEETKIAIEILEKGDLQVSDKERDLNLENLFHEVSQIITEKCVNPTNNKPLTVGLVEKALRDIHFNVKQNRPAKVQALDAIKQLKEANVIPISRAKMRLRLTLPNIGTDWKDILSPFNPEYEEEEEEDDEIELVVNLDPGYFRDLEKNVRPLMMGEGSIEVLNMSVYKEGDEKIE